ncbi:DUF4232 domain-containing protein [Streptomyces xiaopingdaonensis]|uniref:DUF4232 domain-containing protein n=1 Tax=Streptomyces xiaopingdaonensis TaxID=1565415 RepID=UPI0003141973|nr:DUF4232 domain-containing protein [Streptomyces xiaopingdaonensis]
MRAQKLAIAAVALAAGLSLTACQGEDDASANDSSASSSSSGSSSSGSSSSDSSSDNGDSGGDSASADGESTKTESGTGGSSSDDGKARPGYATCRTSQLDMSVNGGMGEGDRVVSLENTASTACALKGFPGVDLKGKDGTFSANRSDRKAPMVLVKPNEKTRFTLHTPRNDTGGSGVDITEIVVTPPNETHSKTLSTRINLPVSDTATDDIRVDPVGTGK